MLHHRLPHDLIELARQIATMDSGRPRQVSMRRSVSTAYYALFQGLGVTIAYDLVTGNDDVRARMWRSFDHASAKRLLMNDEFLRRSHADLRRIGAVFRALQEQRHTADYDPRPFQVGRRRAIELIDEAEEALSLLFALDLAQKRSLSSYLLAKTR